MPQLSHRGRPRNQRPKKCSFVAKIYLLYLRNLSAIALATADLRLKKGEKRVKTGQINANSFKKIKKNQNFSKSLLKLVPITTYKKILLENKGLTLIFGHLRKYILWSFSFLSLYFTFKKMYRKHSTYDNTN